MILIDAVYINNSGGKALLDYFIEKIEETNFKIYYLAKYYYKIKKNYIKIAKNKN